MTKTSHDIITEALRITNIADATGSYPADIKARAEKRYTALHKYLQKRMKVTWGSEAVPDEYEDHVAGMLAGRIARSSTYADKDFAMGVAADSEYELRQLLSKKPRKTVQVATV